MKTLYSFLFLLMFHYATSQTILIGDTGDFPNLEAAENSINAGDTVVLQSQIFSDGTQFLEDINGTELMPVIIKAEQKFGSIFRGGTEAIHLINCSYVEISGIIVEQQTGNGINIDDGGDYSTPSHHITIRNCIFRDMAANGNNDLLKMSGVDQFLIEQCQFLNGGDGGSGIDFVGCHWGTVQDCYFDDPGTSGIQNKGGTQYIRMQRNIFKNVAQRALNLGGSTGLQFFRPPLPDPIVNAFEAADLEVFSNVFIGNWAPIAYVGSIRVKVYHNTFYQPENWVIRILQETTEPGFLPCSNNEFRNNIIYLENDLTEVNIGPNTATETFGFSNNLWFNEGSDSWAPTLPVVDSSHLIGDPLFVNPSNENFMIDPLSGAVGNGLTLTEPTSDFNQKPYAQPPSIGAFEGGLEISSADWEIVENEIFIYPNPTTDVVTIKGDFEDVNALIINHLGQPVRQFSNVTHSLDIDISTISSGIYFLVIENPLTSKKCVKKILKK
ncbi:MAG: T9SS type A sorting domain-containing protein [Bacteroidota bacterium]